MKTNPVVHDEFDWEEVNDQELCDELSKPLSKMNTQRIEEMVKDDYPPDAQEKCDAMLRKLLTQGTHRRRRRWPRYVAAFAACTLTAVVATTGVAGAFSMQRLMEFVTSVVELFSFQSVNSVDAPEIHKDSGPVDMTVEGAWNAQDIDTRVVDGASYHALDDAPYHAGIENILAEYTVENITKSSNAGVRSWLAELMTQEGQNITIQLLIQTDEEDAIVYSVERNALNLRDEPYGDCLLRVAENYDTCSVSWNKEPIQVCIWGRVSSDVLLNIAKEIIGG